MRSKETVLVTAAAGGTGQFAVQLAKLAGNTVVATCGSDDKAQLLTNLGCDRVINYNKEQTKVRLATWPAAEPTLSSASVQAPSCCHAQKTVCTASWLGFLVTFSVCIISVQLVVTTITIMLGRL